MLSMRCSTFGKGDQVGIRVRRESGEDQVIRLPSKAAALSLRRIRNSARTEVDDAADILGISRPLVMHRMDIGDLRFRYVGWHRYTKLKEVLALKTRIEAQQVAMDALAEDAEES
jgi:hypothetical protein